MSVLFSLILSPCLHSVEQFGIVSGYPNYLPEAPSQSVFQWLFPTIFLHLSIWHIQAPALHQQVGDLRTTIDIMGAVARFLTGDAISQIRKRA